MLRQAQLLNVLASAPVAASAFAGAGWNGLRVLEASLAKLGTLGLAKAKKVVLTGFNQGGQAVLYHADRIGTWLRALAPGLQVYKAVPADGLHPRWPSVVFPPNDLQTGIFQNLALSANATAGGYVTRL